MTEGDLKRRFLDATSESLGVIMDLQEELQRVRLDHLTTVGELQKAGAEVEQLRAAGDAMAEALDRHGSHSFCTMLCSVCVNLAAWREARRWDS